MKRNDASIIDPSIKVDMIIETASLLARTIGIKKAQFNLFVRRDTQTAHYPRRDICEEFHVSFEVTSSKCRSVPDPTEVKETLRELPDILSMRLPQDTWFLGTHYRISEEIINDYLNYEVTSTPYMYTKPGWINGAIHPVNLLDTLMETLATPRKELFHKSAGGSGWQRKYRRPVIIEFYENTLQLARREKLLGTFFPQELNRWKDYVIPTRNKRGVS